MRKLLYIPDVQNNYCQTILFVNYQILF